MTDNDKKPKDPYENIELPQSIISSFAAFVLPLMKDYYNSEEGQKAFQKWKQEHDKDK